MAKAMVNKMVESHNQLHDLKKRESRLQSDSPFFYSWNNFSPARIATFKRFSAGVIGQDHISL